MTQPTEVVSWGANYKGRFFIKFNFEVEDAEYCDLKNLDHYNPNGRKMMKM